MTQKELQMRIKRSVERGMSGIQEDPWLAQRVLAKAKKGQEPMKKKLAMTPALALLIAAVATAAIAAVNQIGFLVSTREEYAHDGEKQHAQIQSAEISIDPASESGALDAAQLSADEINAEIQRIVDAYVADFKQSLSDDAVRDTIIRYEVIPQAGRYFTLRMMCYTASASGAETDYYYTIDTVTGERVRLADLFVEGSDYLGRITAHIAAEMRRQTAEDAQRVYWLDDEEMDGFDLRSLVETANFYLNENQELVISFNEGDVAPMSQGIVAFVIPVEALQDIRAER